VIAKQSNLSFDHCADFYIESRHRGDAPARTLLDQMRTSGVSFRSVLDVGTGAGYWLKLIQTGDYGAQKLIGLDVSTRMLDFARRNVPGGEFHLGDVGRLATLALDGVDTIFVCMTLHLLPFPEALREIMDAARRCGARDVVVVEEVSDLYYAVTGNPGYLSMLPSILAEVLAEYIEIREQRGLPSIEAARPGPYPTPPMDMTAWSSLGVHCETYRFHVPADIGWQWHISASDIVREIERRGYSLFFLHAPREAEEIAATVMRRLSTRPGFHTPQELDFWFHWHRFQLKGSGVGGRGG
jgi:SAM-dependent methyltransferase